MAITDNHSPQAGRTWPCLAVSVLATLGFADAAQANEDRKFKAAMASCIRTTDAPGAYVYARKDLGANGLPVVRAAEGGSFRGEVLLNACIEARLRPAGGKRVTTANATVKPVKPAPTRNVGGLKLPAGYPLLQGDPELWNTLTRAQQQRALAFLKSGSTIASSLLGDP